MKTLNSFTEIQSQKFVCAQLVITVLNMHNIVNYTRQLIKDTNVVDDVNF